MTTVSMPRGAAFSPRIPAQADIPDAGNGKGRGCVLSPGIARLRILR